MLIHECLFYTFLFSVLRMGSVEFYQYPPFLYFIHICVLQLSYFETYLLVVLKG